MIAELVSFQNLLKRNSERDQYVDSNVYKAWWSSDSWARGWSRGSMVFLALSTIVTFTWTIAEVLGHLVGTKYGNIWMSLGSVCVNVVLFVCIMIVLSLGASDGKDTKFHCNEWVARYFQKSMLKLLGSSGGVSKFQLKHDLEWNGRLNYLRNEMIRLSEDTTDRCSNMIKLLEDKIAKSENHLRSQSESIEKSLAELKDERKAMKQQINDSFADILVSLHAVTKN